MTTRCKMLFGGFFRQKENFVCLKKMAIGGCPRPLSVCFLFRTSAGRLRVTPFPFPCIETKWQFLKRIRGDRKYSTDMYSINFRNKGWKRIIRSWNLERSSAFDKSPHLNHVTTATMMKTARCVANKKQNSLLTESEATSSQGQVNFSHGSASWHCCLH